MCGVKTPCPDCPFSKAVKPGALGGSNPLVYIGQAHGAFVLPCHKHVDFDDPEWRAKAIDTPQCAGAAIYRTNTGRAAVMPEAIHSLPADTERVFAGPAEFLAHHTGLPLDEAEEFVTKVATPQRLLVMEMAKRSVIHYPKEAA